MRNNNGDSQRLVQRLYEENYNKEGCLMKIIEYNNSNNIFIEFQDEYKTVVHGAYREFKNGKVRNPFFKSVLGVGHLGNMETSLDNISKKSIKMIAEKVLFATPQFVNQYLFPERKEATEKWLANFKKKLVKGGETKTTVVS